MSDLVQQLRGHTLDICLKAANYIERLERDLRLLEAALRVIVDSASDNPGVTHHDHCRHAGCIARRALKV